VVSERQGSRMPTGSGWGSEKKVGPFSEKVD
jgi:hypothetical protein